MKGDGDGTGLARWASCGKAGDATPRNREVTMRILIINPPYQTFTCNLGVGHQTPLGLLMVGGALLDAGHEVELLDAEVLRMKDAAIVRHVQERRPDMVMVGHAGSTPAHPVCMRVLGKVKEACPGVVTVYGGIYPTFHAEEILADEPGVDVVVRGEGEVTAVELVEALAEDEPLVGIAGIAYREGGDVRVTAEREPNEDLDAYRVGWELIEDWDRYQCFGMGRAAVIQFSRGCPHGCTFCGQPRFWKTWRHRSPGRTAEQIEWLHTEHDVRFFHLSDDNPTTDQAAWRAFLEELAARELPIGMYTTIRASDIVRDADLLPLYRKAGVLYVLMGIESTDPEVLLRVRKGETVEQDRLACKLLRENGLFSVAGHLVGFGDDNWGDFRRALRRVVEYDPDWLNVMHVTPHAWTEFTEAETGRRVIETDQSRWDYRHQILEERRLKPWQVLLATKWLEARFHMRPSRLWRIITTQDRFLRRQLWWSLRHTSPVWAVEVVEALLGRRAL